MGDRLGKEEKPNKIEALRKRRERERGKGKERERKGKKRAENLVSTYFY